MSTTYSLVRAREMPVTVRTFWPFNARPSGLLRALRGEAGSKDRYKIGPEAVEMLVSGATLRTVEAMEICLPERAK